MIMTVDERLESLVKWGNAIGAMTDQFNKNEESVLNRKIDQAYILNQWFTPENCISALRGISLMLDRKNLTQWLENYKSGLPEHPPLKIAVIMAGNIPAAGFHDALCVLASGNILLARCASDDSILIPFLLDILISIDARFKDYISIITKVENADAVIATGSNNTSRYFEYYFSKYPHIIRKNRNSIAVLTGNESTEELQKLSHDVFLYFGLGCRNISKIYVPENYDFHKLFNAVAVYDELIHHNKYKNNHDYHHAIFLLNNEKFLTNNFLIVRPNQSLSTPVSVLHYSYYKSNDELEYELALHKDEIQCRVGAGGLPFGMSQQPLPWEYPDGRDTMEFLLNLPGQGRS